MKSFTPTEFRADSSKVYNEVMVSGAVSIDHRDRPSMILITEIELSSTVERMVMQRMENLQFRSIK